MGPDGGPLEGKNMSQKEVQETTQVQKHIEELPKSEKRILARTQVIPSTPEAQKKPAIDLTYMRNKDRELVRGIFRFFEVPGGNLSFSFRKYREDDIENYSLNDGEIYTLPRGVAHHLSNNCWYPEHAYKNDENSRNVSQVTKKKRRCSFEPLDFMDSESLRSLTPNDIETVTFLK
jgi:hypothetical protein